MAVSLATAADYLQRTTGLLTITGDATVMEWVMQPTLPTGGDYNTAFAVINGTPSTYTQWVGIFLDDIPAVNLDADVTAGSNSQSTGAAAAGVWQHVCWVKSGNDHSLYVNAVLIGTFTRDISSLTPTYNLVGGDSFGFGGTQVAYVRQWTTALNVTQIATERVKATAQVTTGLWLDTPLASTLNDVSGNGRHWTQTGSGTFTDQPPLNLTYEGATLLTVPATVAQYLTMIPAPNHEVWYTFVAPENSEALSVFARGYPDTNYRALMRAYSGTPPAQLDTSDSTNVPMAIPIESGETYFFRIRNVGGAEPLDGALNISTEYAPRNAVARGSLVINDDVDNLPVTYFDDEGNIQQMRGRFPSGDAGASIDGVAVLLEDRQNSQLVLYTPTYTVIAIIPWPSPWAAITHIAAGSDRFYVMGAALSGNRSVRTISTTGTVGSTLYDLGSVLARGMGANEDNTILYYTQSTSFTAIKRWNLLTNAAMSDLAAGDAAYPITCRDVLLLSDGTIVVGARRNSGDPTALITRYDTSGTTLTTYTDSTDLLNRMVVALADASVNPAFWAWYFTPDDERAKFQLIDAITTTVLQEFYQPLFIGGVNQDPDSTDLFGISDSCPIWVQSVALEALPPPGPAPEPSPYIGTQERIPIRRYRRTPTLYDENHRLFIPYIEFDVQVGVGNSTGEEEDTDPELLIRASRDGGYTWGNERRESIGRIGQYGKRVRLNRWGVGRKWVFEIVSSAAVNVVLMNLYLTVTKGEN